jgi:hypothetical protein
MPTDNLRAVATACGGGAQALVQDGVNPDSLKAVGYGDTKPAPATIRRWAGPRIAALNLRLAADDCRF